MKSTLDANADKYTELRAARSRIEELEGALPRENEKPRAPVSTPEPPEAEDAEQGEGNPVQCGLCAGTGEKSGIAGTCPRCLGEGYCAPRPEREEG